MYINQAKRLETLGTLDTSLLITQKGRFAEAEKLLVSAEEHTLAINMYKNAHRYDDVIRLVSLYHKDLLKETYKTLVTSYFCTCHLHYRSRQSHWKMKATSNLPKDITLLVDYGNLP